MEKALVDFSQAHGEGGRAGAVEFRLGLKMPASWSQDTSKGWYHGRHWPSDRTKQWICHRARLVASRVARDDGVCQFGCDRIRSSEDRTRSGPSPVGKLKRFRSRISVRSSSRCGKRLSLVGHHQKLFPTTIFEAQEQVLVMQVQKSYRFRGSWLWFSNGNVRYGVR
jgi:hypothetical protein